MKNIIDDITLLQKVFESSVEGILILDDKGSIIKANPEVETMFGYSYGKLLQKKMDALISGKFETHLGTVITQSKTIPLNQEEVLWGIKKDGSQFSLDASHISYIVDGKQITIIFLRDCSKQINSTIHNVSVQKKIEKELSQKEAQNKAMLDAMPDMMFIQNRQGIYMDSFCADPDKLPIPPEQFMGKHMKDVLPEHMYTRIDKAHKLVLKSGHLQVTEYQLKKPDGLRYYEARIVLLNQHGILTIVRDITDRKKAEQELLENEAKTRALLQTLPDLMILYDKYGNHLEVHAPENFQLPAPYEKHIGQNIDAILPKKACEIIRRGFVDCEKTKEIQTVEYTFTIKGKLRHLESRIVQTDDGNFLTVIRDITNQKEVEVVLKDNENRLRDYAVTLEEKVQERTHELKATVQKLVESNLSLEDQILVTKKIETKLLESQTLFSAIAKNFPKGIISVIDKDFKIHYSEGEGKELMGLKDYPFVGMNVDKITVFNEERKARLKHDVKRTLAGEHVYTEIEINNIIFGINTTPLRDDKNNITSALFVHTDITQQKKVAQKIQIALEKEQELNELKSRFIAMASHEFRTPLTAILASAILIGKQNEAGKEAKREKYVAQIERNVKGLVTILNDFLSLSKLEEGKVEAKLEALDIISFSKTIIREITPNLKSGQSIKLKSDHTSINVHLDSKLMHHILANLLSNAIKYSPENKAIILKISTKAKQLYIEVMDQGIGIPLEEQPYMFQRFYRAKNTANIEGTGLGLNIIKQYAELMNGKVSLKSKLNEGSTFSVALPIDQK